MNGLTIAATVFVMTASAVVFCFIPVLFAYARKLEEHSKAIYISNLINAWKYDQAMKTTASVPPPPKPKNPGPKLYPLK